MDPAVKFVTRGSGYQLFLTAEGATWALERSSGARRSRSPQDPTPAIDVLRMRLVGARADGQVTGLGQRPGKVHYFRGSDRAAWQTDVPTFARVRYTQVYPGIDLEYYGRDEELEYDFVVAAGADPAAITLRFDGAGRVSIDEAGDLVLDTPAGRLVQRRPVAYQEVAGDRRIVQSRYVMTAADRVGFAVGPYDSHAPLVIDPVISYSTFLGGTGGPYGEQSYGVTTDAFDNIYLTGKTASTTFPAAGGQPASNDVFVVKMTPDGEIEYVAIVNGNASDSGEAIAVDASGRVVVTGFTDSTNFPTVNPIQLDRPYRDAFLLKLDPSGVIVYSTYLGGSNAFDYGEAVAVDASGNAYVGGATRSGDFPVLNAFRPVAQAQEGFVVKVDPQGNMLYGTYVGGLGAEAIEGIAVDAQGSFYVTGWTTSTNFPRVQSSVPKQSGEDVFVSQYTPDGSALVYSRYLGGNSHERASAIAADGEGGVYVGGQTDSTNFPLILPLQANQPGTDAFLARLAPGGVLTFSTYLGGGAWERVLGLAARDGYLYATGQTFSPDFMTLDAVQPAKAGTTTADAFVVKIDILLSTLVYSTFLGGSAAEEGRGVAPLPGGNVFVTGWTESADFPTVRPIQDFKSNIGNVFVTRIAPVGVDAVSPGFTQTTGGTALTITGRDFLAGATVVVGGVPAADVVVLNAETVTATAPALSTPGTVDVTVTNPDGGSGTLYRALTVVNGSGPVADAGPNQSLEATSAAGAVVTLDATASFDPDNEALTYEWRDQNGGLLASGAVATVVLSVGEHTITLIASDGHSTPGTDTVDIKIVDTTPPSVMVASPNGSNKIYTGTPAIIEWTADDAGSGPSAFDVYLSTDGGATFGATPICSGVPGTTRTCTWTSPGPATTKGRIRVTARDGSGNVSADASNANFSIIAGTAYVKVTAPNTNVNWGAGSTQQITWKHNLGTAAFTRLELSTDGGASWSLIHPAVKNTAGSSGVYSWTLPNALSSAARIRATWTNGAAADVSDANFTIALPYIGLTAPTTGVSWGYDTARKLTWTTNLGQADRVTVLLSTDGGAAFPIELLASAVASSKTASFVTPALAVPTASAQVRVVWANAPAGFAAHGTSPGFFSVEPPFVTVTSPDGGNLWTVGTSRPITWMHNLGTLEGVRIELSLDDGVSFPVVVLSSTVSDGSQSVTVGSSWTTTLGRIRITWVDSPSVTDTSNASFVIR